MRNEGDIGGAHTHTDFEMIRLIDARSKELYSPFPELYVVFEKKDKLLGSNSNKRHADTLILLYVVNFFIACFHIKPAVQSWSETSLPLLVPLSIAETSKVKASAATP